MKFQFIRILFISLLTLICSLGSSHAKSISIMSYNTENLFDTLDDPDRADEDFTPDGRYRWNTEKLKLKIQQLGKVITSIKNPDGMPCPDVLSMVEVENALVLKMLKEQALSACEYKKTVIDKRDPDPRGIKVSLMTRFPVVGQPISHFVYDTGRVIQETHVNAHGTRLVIFVNHWKSRIPSSNDPDGGKSKRALAAKILRTRMNELYAEDPGIEMIVTGDLNDEFEDDSIRKVLGTVADPEKATNPEKLVLWESSFDLLHDPRFDDLPTDEEKYAFLKLLRATYYFAREKAFNQLDHLLVSPGLLDDQGLTFIPKSFKVVRLVMNTDPQTKGPRRFTAFEDENGHFSRALGASDHFPILIRLAVQENR